MNHKIELDQNFLPRNDLSIVRYHNKMVIVTIIFSLPIIGWSILFITIIFEYLRHKIRVVRLMVIFLLYKVLKHL